MDGQMSEWMDGSVDGCMDGWMSGSSTCPFTCNVGLIPTRSLSSLFSTLSYSLLDLESILDPSVLTPWQWTSSLPPNGRQMSFNPGPLPGSSLA